MDEVWPSPHLSLPLGCHLLLQPTFIHSSIINQREQAWGQCLEYSTGQEADGHFKKISTEQANGKKKSCSKW
jgi:hypothetical protein